MHYAYHVITQEEALVALYKEVHSFNHTFWAHHNEEFKQVIDHFKCVHMH